MAILTQSLSEGDGPITGWPIEAPAPAGNHMGVCLRVKDSFGIQRPKYEDSSVIETLDVTRFLFGLADGSMIQTSEMKISAHEKSKLMGYIGSWLGITNGVGFDTKSVTGKGAMINVVHKQSKTSGRTYADITSISPIPQGMEGQIPDRSRFVIPGTPTQTVEQAVQAVQAVQAQVAQQPVTTQPVTATTVTVDQPQPAQATLGQQFTQPASPSVPF